MQLQDILYKTPLQAVQGSTAVDVNAVAIDSRNIKPGAVFVAVRGGSDGHRFIDNAVQNGAVAVVCETLPEQRSPGVVYVQVADSAAAAGIIAHNFYGQPSARLKLVGVTGTNGKTTIATLLYQLFSSLGFACGLISTVQNRIGAATLEATHTTPDPVSLNALLGRMVEEGCDYAFMEVSSHAIHQHRIGGLQFAGALFSNITHDHLDYHKTFDEYIRVKKSFFDQLPKEAFALTNVDDRRGMVMVQNTRASVKTYSLRTTSDFKGKILDNSIMGLHMMVDEQEVHFRLIGEFNAYNLLAVYGAAVCLGEDKVAVLQALSVLNGAAGRFEYLISPRSNVIGIVDYAHTPDALLNVLATIKKLRKGFEQIITVVGCGGNRDRTKRPVMAEVACEYSDKVIFTSDNPRNEDPQEIIKDMEAGVPAGSRRKCLSITDRREAIKTAISLASPSDIVLVAGKGHETYQEASGVRTHFDDREVLREVFELLEK
ncbi:UDP-N-acetylmuramoyl-L-alanyl-D-glutamate--2,6-diaminopimelate ligase [Niabella drilacis]|uniref:UDP-N-acetylmuramoyl-L-alanyl-D-glutamate--2,6-diaminopimelate ligase n=1 Tax=Niabella drilacis (strain DSM 25811 / CCM 8410 / CCUG 62505 / LMG 26954 / E90) TaxID=1285928 RepID=A0A1G6T2R1_NIADE|nr:UDP-N-acetylmuramoyl-L-alanyl-D-glutamate--2,6-diaminopimelate ligase [Niabella drilacis]SDD22665.1 UDP-N-acetylmuramoylalanyl-D-glutamate--2,6-diaminopimelate ligase [Niabella drilacis]